MNLRRIRQLSALLQPAPAILILLAIGGILLSVYAGWRESLQHRAIARLRLAEAVDVHFGAVQDHLIARETLAGTVASLFTPPPIETPRALGEFGNRVIAMAPEIATVGWLPEIQPAHANLAMQSLIAANVERPRFVGNDGRTIDPATLDRPLYPVIDIAPERNRRIIGIDAGAFPDRLAAIRQARDTRKVARTAPLRLVQAPGENAILLYAPVFDSSGRFSGVMGFGYRVDLLFQTALLSPKSNRDFAIRVFTESIDEPLFTLAGTEEQSWQSYPGQNAYTQIERTMEFGGRALRFSYLLPHDLDKEGFWRGFLIAASGIALTAAALSLLGLLANRASVLALEVKSRRYAEERLKVLIHELNHRVRNVMSIAQAVIRLSFTSGTRLSDIQKVCEGRLQALANAMSLLTESDWKSIGFRRLLSQDGLPFAERIEANGPDFALKARAAQTFALLFYELASNAAKHGALSTPAGKVLLDWRIDRSGNEPVFRMKWRETGGPAIASPNHRGFGELLVRRIAPRDISGRSKVDYPTTGFEYELEAPLRELVEAQPESVSS